MNTLFKLHDENSASEKVRPLLAATSARLGFIPNLLAAMAESPELAQTFIQGTSVTKSLSLSALEREIVTIAISRENDCGYCIANHLMILNTMKVPTNLSDALRNNRPLPDPKLQSLYSFTTRIVREKGGITADEQAQFIAAGYLPAQALEIILMSGIYAMSNFANRLLQVELDTPFQPFAVK